MDFLAGVQGTFVPGDLWTFHPVLDTLTAGRLLTHMEKETGVRLSPNRFRALLKRCGYVYRQPTHDLSDLQDPKAKEAAQELLDWLKKTPSSTKPSSFSLWTKRP